MSVGLITLFMFVSLFACLATGVPIAFALGGVAVISTALLWGGQGLYVIFARTWSTMFSEVLLCVPLFIFLGQILLGSGLADALYTMIYRWAGKLRGALAMGTTAICVPIGAMSAISGAAAISLGLIAIPSMLKRNYDKVITVGTVAGASTLCLIVPPSITLILFGALSNVSIGQLFIGGVIPGVLLALLFIIYLAIQALRHPALMPALPPEERVPLKEKVKSTLVVVPTLGIIMAVLGTIFLGVATPTEAAAVGVVACLVVSVFYRRLSWKLLKKAITETTKITAMVMWILIAAYGFAATYQALGAAEWFEDILLGMGGRSWIIVPLVLLIALILGMFIDPGAICALLVPLVVPILVEIGHFHILWFAMLFNIALMIGYLSPPFGLVLFYMKSVCPAEITITDIYRSVIPFIVLEIVGMGIIAAFPDIVLWLPRLVMGIKIVG